MSLEGVKLLKQFTLRTDLFHHTHEVWGPCSYKNIPLRRRGPRVLESYCSFQLFQLHFSTLGHFGIFDPIFRLWALPPPIMGRSLARSTSPGYTPANCRR